MSRYYFAEHTADIRLIIEADNLKNVFSLGLMGMNELLGATITDLIIEEKHITIESCGIDVLLIDFLSEILYLSNSNKAIYTIKEIFEINEKKIICKLSGKKIKKFTEDIKAVTYHEASVKEEDGIIKARVIFDL